MIKQTSSFVYPSGVEHARPFLGRRRLLVTLASTASTMIAVGATAGRVSAGEHTAMLPRAILFADPMRSHLRISADGNSLAWLEAAGGLQGIIVAPLGRLDSPRRIAPPVDRSIAGFTWAFTGRHIVFWLDPEGNERYELHVADIEDGRIMTLFSGASSYVQQRSRRHPAEILVAHNARSSKFFDLVRTNILTGERQPIFQNPGFISLTTTAEFDVRFGTRYKPDGSAEIAHREPDASWSTFAEIPPDDLFSTSVNAISNDGRSLFLIDSRDVQTATLKEIDIQTRKSRVLASDPEADIVSALYDPITNKPFAAVAEFDRKRWHTIDASWSADLNRWTERSGSGDFSPTSISADARKLVLNYYDSDHSNEFRLYNRDDGSETLLFPGRPGLSGTELRPMQPITVTASDGVQLQGYLMLPSPALAQGGAVLFVHGGPYSRVEWGYWPLHQWLANRGYAVLALNFRGSTGFGKKFVQIADHEWGGRMQDDLSDAATWLISTGTAHPDKIAIFGSSYGGYASLIGASRRRDKFACAVDLFGISDLVSFMRDIPPYWDPSLAAWKRRLADPDTRLGSEWLAKRSPLAHADSIQCPVLVAQGLKDVRVRSDQSERMVKLLLARNIPVVFVTFADEGHGFTRQENRIAFSAVAEAFLARYLGGRAEPVGDAFRGSSLHFEVGRDILF